MDPRDVKRWAENYEAAVAREAAERRRHRLTPDQAFKAALSLLVIDESKNGSPFRRIDPVTEAEDAAMWEAWTMLRRRWRGGA